MITDFFCRPLVAPSPPKITLPAPRPTHPELLQQFTVLCGNDNFSTWFYQELMRGKCPL